MRVQRMWRGSAARVSLALGLALCTGGASVGAMAVPGDWDPPARTRAIAATQFVRRVGTVLADSSMCASMTPGAACWGQQCRSPFAGTLALNAYLHTRWTYLPPGYPGACRRANASYNDGWRYLSMHASGRAIDIYIPVAGRDADNTLGDPIANWLLENAEYIGVQTVIWDGLTWNGESGFRPISDTPDAMGHVADHHLTHIHMEPTPDGANQLTRFFTMGPPGCSAACDGTTVVRADCSTTNCAATGETCLEGLGMCGPAEAPEATSNASAPLPTATLAGPLTRLQLFTPRRLFDTRTPSASTDLVRSDGSTGALGATRTATFNAWGAIPADATAVWLNLAAIPSGTAGFLSVFPTGPQPPTATLTYQSNVVRANGAAVSLGTSRGVTLAATSDLHVVGDLGGAFARDGAGLLRVTPFRALDTRSTGVRLAANAPYTVEVAAPAGALGVVANLAVLGADAGGFVRGFPCGSTPPEVSHVNFGVGEVSSNVALLPTSGTQVCFQATSAVDLIVDVVGYLVPSGELSYQPLTPTRLLDTRSAGGLYAGRVGVHQVLELPLQRMPGMPANVSAATVNITATQAARGGFLVAYPCGAAVPPTSNLNFAANGTTSGAAIVATGGGSVCLYSSSRAHLVVDLSGVWLPTPGAPPPTSPSGQPEDPETEPDMPTTEDGGVASDGAVPGADAGSDASFDGGRAGASPACGCRTAGAPVGTRRRWGVLGLGLAAALRTRRRRAAPRR